MILEGIAKVSSTLARLAELVFTGVVNLVVSPLSLLYTLLTQTAGRQWKLSDLSGVYYFWWSNRDKIVKCSNESGLTGLVSKHSNHPRTFILVLGLILVPIILAAAIRALVVLCSKAANKYANGEDSEIIDAEVVGESERERERIG